MNGASKILTVSYGTFSCTLEGFEEPFNTMKAIAEYFRDLASDDRYFGAEPPTPDAAMLHKIAEREIQRRVEAKVSDNGVLLRADDAPAPRVTMPAAPTLAPETAPNVESAAARLSRLRAAQTQILAPAPVLGDISSRFLDVEAYAEDQDTPTPVPQTVLTEPAPIPDLPQETVAVVVDATPTAEPIIDIPEVAQATVEAEPEAVTHLPEVMVEAEPEVVTDLPEVLEAVAEGEAVTNMPAVVETTAKAEPITDRPEVAEVTAKAEPEPITDIPADVEATIAAEPEAIAQTVADVILAPEADLAALNLTTAEPHIAAFPEALDHEEQDTPAQEEVVLASLRETLAGLMGQDDQLAADMSEATEQALSSVLDLATPDQMIADMIADTLPEDQPALDDEPAQPDHPADLMEAESDLAESDLAESDLADLALLDGDSAAQTASPPQDEAEPAVDLQPQAPIVAEKLQRARARVIKIRRLDKKPDAAPLSPEAEADLQNTLAALSAEIAPTPALALDTVEAQLDAELAPPELVPEMAPELAPQPAPADRPDTKIAATDDAAVDRLLAQTNTQLEVPEVKRRRSAIAHLKAAVLATVADRRNNPGAAAKGTEVKMDPYRKDLDQAVRPSTPTDRPAPLVLVSEQRIDRKRDAAADALRPMPQIVPSVAASQPVRPRRVTAGGLSHAMSAQPSDDLHGDLVSPDALDNIFAGSDKLSFADFAESLGAENLAELIEAAGAYCTLVLDRPSFSRPLLFQQMSTLPHLAELSREDGLRGFGKLLRDGRIQKTERGQFALSSTSPILTEAKRIAS